MARDRHIAYSEDGQPAWFDELLDPHIDSKCPGTGVLVNTEQGWKTIEYHLAFHIPNDKVETVMVVINP